MKKLRIVVSLFLALTVFMISIQPVSASKKSIHVTAIGDSLTYGVGDSTKHGGGYTYLIKKPLQKTTKKKVVVKNFGISGETSSQILNRTKKKTNIQDSIKQSDIIVLTAGGNDVMAALRKYGIKLSPSQLSGQQQRFDANLNELIQFIRQQNTKAPIYIIGIYNPFEVYVKDATGVKQAVENWNNSTNIIAGANKKTHYVDVTKLATPKKMIYSKKNQTTTNPLLYKKDYFHPNNQGYQLMTDLLWKQMKATQNEWR